MSELVFPVTLQSVHELGEGTVVRLAKAWDTPLRLVHASDSIEASHPELEAFATRLRKRHPGLEVLTKHLYGDDAGRAIADTVSAHSLIVMTTKHADEWKMKGSVTETVLHSAGVPVLIFGPHALESDLVGEVVVGLDGTASAEYALEPASGIAAAIGGRLWLVRVVPTPPVGEPAPHHPEIVEYLEEHAARLGGPGDVGWEIIQNNDPVEALEFFAAKRQAALLVAGARGRNNTTRRSMGSITMGLVAQGRRPVLTLEVPDTPELPNPDLQDTEFPNTGEAQK